MLIYHCSKRTLFSGGSDTDEKLAVVSSHAQAATSNTSTQSGMPFCHRDSAAFRYPSYFLH